MKNGWLWNKQLHILLVLHYVKTELKLGGETDQDEMKKITKKVQCAAIEFILYSTRECTIHTVQFPSY